ncbi:thioredoxin domain-containing protein [Herbiconiux sp. L3-i23]|uniref:thioredoxin domain-containing protein n=1 Tax=Herbiconiux sp. L3-i23 TaxID=2905871 RepID=UPI0020698EA4|nr:DUF255 domain-containing protein [Herbiconiux sp. L3-i23]BDI23651.1 thioredoxin domain-containing protein [Herbiconiux sp. L3-i23]
MNRLGDAVSPYLRSHADNPVDWWRWGPEPFAEARERDVPVFISIGYATCHWCHVMARESFSDAGVAELLRERFVSIKVDREEHPDVDASYLTAAGAFTQNLGWPLTVFATPEGRTFFATTYCPPEPVAGHPSFRQVLDAVWEAWTQRRAQVDDISNGLAAAIVTSAAAPPGDASEVDFARVVSELAEYEDVQYGGFGGAPKFPVAPVVLMLQRVGDCPLLEPEPRAAAAGLARRMLEAMAQSPLRDPVEGGFFRYGTRRDWSEPHYERMLYDNALLLRAYAEEGDDVTAEGIVGFLRDVLRRDGGAFGSAQDSESLVDGVRSEGGYYGLSAGQRTGQPRPAVDGKVLTGWNGLAIGALAVAGRRAGRPDWVALAAEAADRLLEAHVRPDRFVRASLDGRESDAAAALEDYGMLARGLLDLALASGEAGYAVAARDLIDRVTDGDGIALPGGGDPTLASHGLGLPLDPSEGAYPSGLSQIASASLTLYELTGDRRYRRVAEKTLAPVAGLAASRPISMGGTLSVLADLRAPSRELLVVTEEADGPLARLALDAAGTTLVTIVSRAQAAAFAEAGFDLFAGRVPRHDRDVAYLCEDLVCRLPVSAPADLAALLVQRSPGGSSASPTTL